MLYLCSILSTSLLYFSILAECFPNPETCLGACGYVHDPYVVRRDDGTYFRFATFKDIQIATAPSMKGPWRDRGSVLPRGSQIPLPGNDSLWAPDVHKVGSTYYLYYAVSVSGSQNSDIGLATSPSMDPGSWTDHGSLHLPRSPHYNLIDPNLLIVHYDLSNLYLSFGSFWDDIYQLRMLDPATPMPGAVPQQVAYTDEGAHPLEGSFQFWWPTAGVVYYYLFVSRGACCNEPPNLAPPGQEYQVVVCRSTVPTGPFVDKRGKDCRQGGGELVLASHGDVYAPGGQGVVYDEGVKGVVLYYHYVNTTIGYREPDFQFGWNHMVFRDNGWPEVVAAH